MPTSYSTRLTQCLVCLIVTGSLSLSARSYAQDLRSRFDAFDFNTRLGNAINLGNTLEAPNEGEWGFRLSSWHFSEIAGAGFDSVRVPIRFSAHALEAAPYTLDPKFLNRIDWVVQEARDAGLAVILDMHHYEEMFVTPDEHAARFVSLWQQIAERYQHEPVSSLYFELLNEPHEELNDERWSQVIVDTLAVVRPTNPDRMVIVGPTSWNSYHALKHLQLPEEDRNLIATIHYYEPFLFTHQGAEWIEGSEPWLGTTWTGTTSQRNQIVSHFRIAERWSERNDRPIFLGEFGAYSTGDIDSRNAWTEFVRTQAEEHGFSWAYWEFAAGFGAFDRETRTWREPILDALSPKRLMSVNDDMEIDVEDIDALTSAVARGETDPTYDLDRSGQVDLDDVYFWVFFSNHMMGDADLNGAVDFGDFLVVSDRFGRTGSWSSGDFDADGSVTFADFLILSQQFAATPVPLSMAATVPEPSISIWWWMLGVATMGVRSIRPRHLRLIRQSETHTSHSATASVRL